MTSKLTREELLNIIETDHVQCGEASALARMALAAMDSKMEEQNVVCWSCRNKVEISAIGDCDGYCPNCNSPIDLDEEPYTAPQSAPDRDQVRSEHAEWSQATFGNVGPIGPLKHLSKEALEAAAEPCDLSEWADMQFLLWDAQRRAGITDDQITQAMIEKLAVNKQREWPEPKDGEPRFHIKEQPAPVVKCTHAICRDGCCNSICPDCLENIHEVREPYSTAYLSSPVVPDEMDRIGAFDMFDSLPDGDVVDCVQYTWNACRAAMLNGGKS